MTNNPAQHVTVDSAVVMCQGSSQCYQNNRGRGGRSEEAIKVGSFQYDSSVSATEGLPMNPARVDKCQET